MADAVDAQISNRSFVATGSMELDASLYPLHVAAQSGDEATLIEYLNAGYDVNSPDPEGRSPLVFASVTGNLSCLSLLIRAGADFDQLDNLGLSPTHWACSQEQHKSLAALLDVGANWAAQDKDGRTALHYSCATTSSKCVVAIVKTVQNPDYLSIPDNEGMTPMHWACFHNRPKHVAALIKNGGTSGVIDNEGKTPLHWAAENPDLPCLLALLTESDLSSINVLDERGQTAAHIAVAKGDLEMVRYFISVQECDINAIDHTGRALLHWATASGFVDIVELLLEAQANVALKDASEATPLHYAAQLGVMDAIVAIMRINPSVASITDSDGRTPMMWAVLAGKAAEVEKLIECGAPLDTVDNDKRTALHLATMGEAYDVVNILIQRGASLTVVDISNQTPLFYPSEHGSLAMVKLLLTAGSSMVTVDDDGRTPLHWSAVNGHQETVDLLARHNKDGLDIIDKDGKTALAYSCYQGQVATARVLLASGASYDLLDKEGVSAMHWAALEGHLEVVAMLLEAGAYINPMELNGSRLTPLDYALINNHTHVAQMLADHSGLTISDIKVAAATSIQAHMRGFLARKLVKGMRQIKVEVPEGVTALHISAVTSTPHFVPNALKVSASDMDHSEPLATAAVTHTSPTGGNRPKPDGVAPAPAVVEATAAELKMTAEQKILAARKARHTIVKQEQRRVMLVRDYIKAATLIQRAWRKFLSRERKRQLAQPADVLFRNQTFRNGNSTSPIRGGDTQFQSPSWGDRLPGKTHARTMRSPLKESLSREQHFKLLMGKFASPVPPPVTSNSIGTPFGITGRVPKTGTELFIPQSMIFTLGASVKMEPQKSKILNKNTARSVDASAHVAKVKGWKESTIINVEPKRAPQVLTLSDGRTLDRSVIGERRTVQLPLMTRVNVS